MTDKAKIQSFIRQDIKSLVLFEIKYNNVKQLSSAYVKTPSYIRIFINPNSRSAANVFISIQQGDGTYLVI